MLLKTVITALISFVSTNIDDIFVLMFFFSQIERKVNRRNVILGQYLGMGALVGVSIIAALGTSIILHEYVRWLGIIPIVIGVKAFFDYRNEDMDKVTPSVLKVFTVTVANGGDNVGIYIPLFASMNEMAILLTVFLFACFIAIWCVIGIKLAAHPLIQATIKQYEGIVVPVIFIGLGVLILMTNTTMM